MPEDYYGEDYYGDGGLSSYPAQAAPSTSGDVVDPYTGLTMTQRDAQIAELMKSAENGTFDFGDPGIIPSWEKYSAPSYSTATMEYLSNLDKYITQNDPSFGMMYSKAPTVDLSTPDKIRQYSLYGIGDFLPEEQVSAYANKPLEQNVGFSVAPTEAGVGKNVTGALDVGYNTPIILRNDATGEIVYQGTGFAGAQEAARLSNQMSATGDKKTQWSLLTGDPGATDISQFNVVAQDKPDYLGGVLGALVQYGLPIGLSLIPGLNWVGSAALAGAGSTAGKLVSGYDLDDALKAGLITAGTAGLLKAPVLGGGSSLGGTIGSALESVPGVGDALRGASNVLAGGGGNAGAQAAADALANEIVVTGIKSATPSLISGAAGSLLGSAALDKVIGNSLINTPTDQLLQPPQTLEEQFDDILVKGGRLPVDTSAIAGAAPAVVGNATGMEQGPLSQEQVTQEQQQAENPNEIVVTADKTPLDLGGLSSGAISSLPSSLIPDTAGAAQGPLSQEQVTQEQPSDNEIVVTGDKTPLNLDGALSNLVNTVAPSVTTPLEDLAVKPAEQPTEQKQEQPSENEIVVTGDKTPINLDGALSNLVNTVAPSLTTPLEDLAVKPAEQPTEQKQEQQTEDIIAEGKRLPVDTSAVAGAAPAAVSTGSTYNPVDNEVVVTAKPKPNTLDDIAASTISTLAPSVTTPLDKPPTTTTETQPEDKGGLSTTDKLRLALAALGAIGGGAAGGGAGATLPSGFGRRDPIYSAKLPTPGVNGAFAVGGLGGSTLPMPAGGDLTKFGMGNATRAAPTQIPQYGGVNPPGFNTQTWDWLGPQQTVAKDIMDQLAVLPSSAAPVAEPVKKAMGGYAVGGPGDGRSDEIPALLSDGEYVIDAETVALLGNGSNKAGAKQLDKFRANIRKHKGRQLARGKFSVKAKQPDAYLSGGR